jgi:hypothetical protein
MIKYNFRKHTNRLKRIYTWFYGPPINETMLALTNKKGQIVFQYSVTTHKCERFKEK